MPVYDYRCRKCGKKFSLTMTIEEHGEKRVRCSKCKSLKVGQLFSGFFPVTSRKS